MMDFSRLRFIWKGHPFQPDPYYKYPGGFVGEPGDVYHVRFNLEARAAVRHLGSGASTEIFVGAPCRHEYTIARRNLFQVPSAEFRMAFSRRAGLTIAARPSEETETSAATPLAASFQEHRIDVRGFGVAKELVDAAAMARATLDASMLNAVCTYESGDFAVTLEFPANLINVNEADSQFQVCTGPVVVPDLRSWDGAECSRVFLAHAAFSAFDHLELILQRQLQPADAETAWLGKPRGRDRNELRDPAKVPPAPRGRWPLPTTYHEVWEVAARNVVLAAPNTAPLYEAPLDAAAP